MKLNNNIPLVSVNILSYNRKEELRNTLQRVYEQSYKNIEVNVVDNASTDNTAEMVSKEFPEVHLVVSEKNTGISGWNKGFQIAKGEYILLLDDDSYPDYCSVEKGIERLNESKTSGILAYNIFNKRLNKSENADNKYPKKTFIGCGALVKKEVIKNVGMFNELIFIYSHELEYSIRLYNSGYEIIFAKDLIVFHDQTLKSRGKISQDPFSSGYRFLHSTVSEFIILIQNFSLRYLIIYLPKYILNRIIIVFFWKYYSEFYLAIKQIIVLLPQILRKRKCICHKTQKYYEFGKFPFIDRTFFPKFDKNKTIFTSIRRVFSHQDRRTFEL